jgi:hypothetical protein
MREWAMFQKLVKGESFRRRLRSPDIEPPSHARGPERVASSTLASINRPISDAEAEIVLWLLQHASLKGPLPHLEARVRKLRVVSRCDCGCPTVNFTTDWPDHGIIAEAMADRSAAGVILFGSDDEIRGLEFYAQAEAVKNLPPVSSLRTY